MHLLRQVRRPCAQGAISLKCGKITLLGPETGKNADPEPEIRKRKKAGRVAWGIAIAVLLFAVAWFNFIEPAIDRSNAPATAVTEQTAQADAPAGTEAETAAPETEAGTKEAASGPEEKSEPAAASADLTVGTEVGNLLPDFTTELLSGETFRLSDCRGRVVIINFWGTTCAPCVAELPYYEQLKVQYPDVEILAIHNRAGAKKAKDFLADKGWDHLDFALDSKEKGLLPLLNAADAMPQTIILDQQGRGGLQRPGAADL